MMLLILTFSVIVILFLHESSELTAVKIICWNIFSCKISLKHYLMDINVIGRKKNLVLGPQKCKP